ncbi:hypothetical protein [Roseovarius sp. ZX-A-9]|uniref:hypothetical protein n=1 Tax=Roseovarius sp. ZX-A-9 TaxID=3014783 RepID=UPI00232C9EB0|nr:hypothetical protein [Roseovarius sp. ZX-A-9]
MPKYNPNFELSADDIALIEDALHQTRRALSATVSRNDANADATQRRIHDLLGRLDSQKVCFHQQDTCVGA